MSTDKKETHILIVWPNSRQHLSRILKEISFNFTVEESFKISINALNSRWLENFYARSLAYFNKKQIKQIMRAKRAHIGTGKAIVLKLGVTSTNYSCAKTINGIAYVNTVCLETKQKLRILTKGGVHLSDSLIDLEENQFHLNQLMDGSFKSHAGFPHKNSIMDFFEFLNTNKLSYLSMRGHTYITKDLSMLTAHKKDIDLLIDKDHLNKLLTYPFIIKLNNDKAERYTLSFVHNSKYRTCKLDIYPTGSGIIPPDFEKKILSNSQLIEVVKSLPPFSLDGELLELYHYVFHKRYLPGGQTWNNKILKDIATRSPEQILSILEKFGLNQVTKNPYYPDWASFPSLTTLNRYPIQRRLQNVISGKQYFSYVFEDNKGQIIKEGGMKNIQNEYAILNTLAKELNDIVPTPISIHIDEKYDLGVLTMTKIKGVPFRNMGRYFWNFNSLKDHLNSSLNTLRVFQKHGIHHRDINPSNLLYSKNHIMFIDFGWSISPYEKYENETPAGLNSGFYKDPKGHNDVYSLVKCFTAKHIFPPFLKRLLLSYDLDLIQERINSLNIAQKITIELFLKSQKLLLMIVSYKRKMKRSGELPTFTRITT